VAAGAALVLALGLLAACHGPVPRTAPFRNRPDATRAGKLDGPFDGKVVDAESGEPVAGALLYATWTLQARDGSSAVPAGFRDYVTSTDAGGNYDVPALAELADVDGRLTSFHLVIYKRGYVAYRSDRRFDDLGPRRSFTQHRNRVRLARWRPEDSHARHLRYIGGGPALATLTAWEVADAAAELSGTASHEPTITAGITPKKRPGAGVSAARILGADEIKAVTGFDGSFDTGPLRDEPDTDVYSSQHFRAVDLDETHDVALRLWKLDAGDAEARYGQLKGTLPGVEEVNEIANRSFRASEDAIFGVAFLDTERHAVGLLTCGRAQCDSADKAAELARQAYEKLETLWPLGGDE
jgi:hypothetical protein